MRSGVAKSAAVFQPRLRGHTQGLIDETDLANYISLRQPPNLTFSDHVHRLISTYRVYRANHQTKSEASGDPLLDKSMVLLHDIVQIRSRPTAATCAPSSPASFNAAMAWRSAGCPSTLITRGWTAKRPSASCRKCLASTRSRFGDSVKSIVFP